MEQICSTRESLDNYLHSVDRSTKKDTPLSSVYFLIRHNGQEMPVFFFPFEGTYFETPCVLHSCPMAEKELREYVEETYMKEAWDKAFVYEKTMLVINKHYEISCPHTSPWLHIDKGHPVVVVKMLSERECLELLLEQNDKRA